MSAFAAVRARLRELMIKVHGRTYPVEWEDNMSGSDIAASWRARVRLLPKGLDIRATMFLGNWTEPQATGECCLRRLCERYETHLALDGPCEVR